MQTKLMTIFTRTPLHVGSGASVGAVDQPVIRERHTRFPVIPATSLKGVLADLFLGEGLKRTKEGAELFGSDDPACPSAGKIFFGESKLLAFPIRSAKGCFAWITCPLALSRFSRDSGMAFKIPDVADEKALVTKDPSIAFKDENKVIFEEYPLSIGLMDESIVNALAPLCADGVWKEEMKKRLTVLSDDLFSYFVENACEIAQHNRIDDTTGVVANGALFNQENVPSETLFYTSLAAKDAAALSLLEGKISEQNNLLQIGGDSTTGLGWCSITVKE